MQCKASKQTKVFFWNYVNWYWRHIQLLMIRIFPCLLFTGNSAVQERTRTYFAIIQCKASKTNPSFLFLVLSLSFFNSLVFSVPNSYFFSIFYISSLFMCGFWKSDLVFREFSCYKVYYFAWRLIHLFSYVSTMTRLLVSRMMWFQWQFCSGLLIVWNQITDIISLLVLCNLEIWWKWPIFTAALHITGWINNIQLILSIVGSCIIWID